MNLGNITYAEFSLLRELVRAKQMDIWKKEWAPYFTDRSVEEMEKLFQRIMGGDAMHEACYNEEVAIPATDRDCCAMLLRRIDKEEKKIQGILRQGEGDAIKAKATHSTGTIT